MVIRVLFTLRSRETELTMNFTGKVTVVGVLLSFCFLKGMLLSNFSCYPFTKTTVFIY